MTLVWKPFELQNQGKQCGSKEGFAFAIFSLLYSPTFIRSFWVSCVKRIIWKISLSFKKKNSGSIIAHETPVEQNKPQYRLLHCYFKDVLQVYDICICSHQQPLSRRRAWEQMRWPTAGTACLWLSHGQFLQPVVAHPTLFLLSLSMAAFHFWSLTNGLQHHHSKHYQTVRPKKRHQSQAPLF